MKKRFVAAPLSPYYNASFNDGFQEPAARECSELLRDCAARIEKADGTYWGIPITFPAEGKDAIYVSVKRCCDQTIWPQHHFREC